MPTPAEGTSFRLARLDRKHYPEIICSGDSTPYYTNSTQLPVGYTDDLFEALDLQAPLQSRYTGGTVFHAFIGDRITDPKLTAELVKRIATNYRIPYFTLTPTFSICPVLAATAVIKRKNVNESIAFESSLTSLSI